MHKSFIADASKISTPSQVEAIAPTEPSQNREPVRLLVIGSRKKVTSTIHTLYSLGFADISEWSPLLPGPNPGEVMSILTRFISKN